MIGPKDTPAVKRAGRGKKREGVIIRLKRTRSREEN